MSMPGFALWAVGARRVVSGAAVVAALAACSSATTPPDGATQPSLDAMTNGTDATRPVDDVAPPDTPGATPHQFRVSIGPLNLAPTEERTVCVVRRMGNVMPQLIRRVTAHL